MNEKTIEELKTDISSLKIRLRRLEQFILGIPNPEHYIHDSSSDDDLLGEAKKLVSEYPEISASLIQRRLSIGYARAARILDQLEEAGLIGHAEGSKPRKVLIKNK